MRKILVLANQTLNNPEIVKRLQHIAEANPVGGIHVTVPLSSHAAVGGRSDKDAQNDLDALLAALQPLEVELTGSVVADDPVLAAHRAYENERYDMVLISTLESQVSKWLNMDAPHRIGRRFGVHVEHIESTATAQPSASVGSSTAERPSPGSTRPAGPAQVLVVEDNDDDFILAQEALNGTGIEFELKRTREGASALEYFRTNGTTGTDLVLLDLKMPVMTGLELLEAAAKEFDLTKLNIVVVTTSEHPDDRRRAHELGAAGYIIKDPDFTAFQATLKSLLQEVSAG